MITLIPLEFYTLLYFNVILISVLWTYNQSNKISIHDQSNLISTNALGVILLILVIFYMGLRPISSRYFGDMASYANYFSIYEEGGSVIVTSDLAFHYFMKFSSSIMSIHTFFLLCAFLYIYPIYLVSKRVFQSYWFYSFLILIASFSFWSYGTNGIRNGLATSFFLMALAQQKRVFIYLWMYIAVSFHTSLLLPSLAYIVTVFYNKPRHFLFFWLLCIPLSLIGGSAWEDLFATIGLTADDRLGEYLVGGEEYMEEFSSTGFRWDFLLYSATGVFAGWYFITKKEFNDIFYSQLFNIYLIANGFWILIIRAAFSNRFAYLSWFMLGLIIIYPLLKKQMFEKQHQIIGIIICAYFAFTYMLNVILS